MEKQVHKHLKSTWYSLSHLSTPIKMTLTKKLVHQGYVLVIFSDKIWKLKFEVKMRSAAG